MATPQKGRGGLLWRLPSGIPEDNGEEMSKYSVGANFERKLVKTLEADGYFCIRSAGSHSPVDVASFKLGEVKLWQSQIQPYFPPAKREQLIEVARENNFQAWLAYREKRKLVMKQIY